jgi:signal transduction protein with GAF and PtsI domain
VTTDAGRESALPPGAKPLAVEPDLPAPDPDIETAGDRIAEAITYLNTRRRDRREAALRALNRAETSINHALRSNSHDENVRNALHAALKDLDTAERAVQHNAPEAVRQLASINKNLDKISP